jgi:hypothetical protein
MMDSEMEASTAVEGGILPYLCRLAAALTKAEVVTQRQSKWRRAINNNAEDDEAVSAMLRLQRSFSRCAQLIIDG